jgi:NADH-quinone oxidoreductase subunit J
MWHSYFFSFFGFILIGCMLLLLLSQNPVHAILYLVFLFCNGAALLLVLEAEFLSFVYIVVYIGAVAVLFLFVVMMLNIGKYNFSRVFLYVPITFSLTFLLCLEFFFIFSNFLTLSPGGLNEDWLELLNNSSNMEILGNLLFTFYFQLFLIGGIVLLLAMIGAIFLTMQTRLNVRKQDIYTQFIRSASVF